MCPALVAESSLVPDPRSDKDERDPLDEILLLCIIAVVDGADPIRHERTWIAGA